MTDKQQLLIQMALDDIAQGLSQLSYGIGQLACAIQPKAPSPEPTGGPVTAKNGGAIEPEAPKPAAAVTQSPTAAGSHTGQRAP